jgi:hypothetical protein
LSLILTQTDLETILNRDNLVVRNLQITQGYYRLAKGLRKFMSFKNVNWFGFGTRASKTAGQALRHEMMPHLMKSAMIRLAGYENTALFFNDVLDKSKPSQPNETHNLLAEALKRVSLLVSAGNALIFGELAWPVSNLINTFGDDWSYDEQKLLLFFHEHLRPGPVERNGQDHLREAFTAYVKARFETNSKRKAEYVLLGNLLIGLHEQTRVQPYIEQAMAVPLDVMAEANQSGSQIGSDKLTRRLIAQAGTQMMMSISLPSRILKLGRNVVAPTGLINYPADLLVIEDPRCLALVRRFETNEDTLTGSAAHNWSSLQERMRFLVDFFRSHQQYKRLFEAPFTDEQVAAINTGCLPDGPL